MWLIIISKQVYQIYLLKKSLENMSQWKLLSLYCFIVSVVSVIFFGISDYQERGFPTKKWNGHSHKKGPLNRSVRW